jgi:hypothetical protein
LNKLFNLIILICFAISFSCDPKLFESEEEPPAPEVSAIVTSLSNSQIMAGDSAEFWVDASNPGEGSLKYDWSTTGGYFLTPRDIPNVKWRAPFTGGLERIEIRVSNNDKTTLRDKQITVVSQAIPIVNILSPINEAYLVQYETIDIEVEVIHENEITFVEFFVNDESIKILNGNPSNQYKYSWLNNAPAGVAEIKVTAVAEITGNVGGDIIRVNIEGVIPGKK